MPANLVRERQQNVWDSDQMVPFMLAERCIIGQTFREADWGGGGGGVGGGNAGRKRERD